MSFLYLLRGMWELCSCLCIMFWATFLDMHSWVRRTSNTWPSYKGKQRLFRFLLVIFTFFTQTMAWKRSKPTGNNRNTFLSHSVVLKKFLFFCYVYNTYTYVDMVLNANKDCSFCCWIAQAEFSSAFNFDWCGGNIEPYN